MFLTRFTLDARDAQVRSDLADAHRMHRRLMTLFPADLGDTARASAAVLFRVESLGERPVVLMQSTLAPDPAALSPGWLATSFDGFPSLAIRPLNEAWNNLRVGMMLRFRLLANPSRKVETRSVEGQRRNGKRVPLRSEDAALAWLVRKAADAGFSLLPSEDWPERPDVAVTPHGRTTGRRSGGTITVEGVLFEGRLEVTDVEAFRSALRSGVGPGKAFGYGMLSIAAA